MNGIHYSLEKPKTATYNFQSRVKLKLAAIKTKVQQRTQVTILSNSRGNIQDQYHQTSNQEHPLK